MLKRLCLVSAVLTTILLLSCSRSVPVHLHPHNPHYFIWKQKPTVLITSAEHYGAVLNLDFDFATYLQRLQQDGLNLTRTFTGIYCEHPEAFNITKNTLAPAEDKLICPWARSDEPGYANGGNKFDLTSWDDAYFERLKSFIRLAHVHSVVVELVLFCPFYGDEQWRLSPVNVINNINGIGDVNRLDVYTLKHPDLARVQDEMVRKIVTELNEFDNLYYEICNEPYFAGPTLEWQAHISKVIKETEAQLPKKHMIAQNIANNNAKIENPDVNVDLFNFHYAYPAAVDDNYMLNKALGDNETGFAGTHDEPYRLEAWNFIIAGGALFNHLDYSFTVGHEDGTFAFPPNQPGGGGAELRRQIRILITFIESFDFINMLPKQEIFTGELPDGIQARALAKSGEQYALYFSRKQQLEQNFSLRWTGHVVPEYSESYTFYTFTDDGVRLWVNGQKLIDDWTSHAPLENSGSINLVAGVPVDIQMDYFQGLGGAKALLLWYSSSQVKEVISQDFYTLPDGSAPGLKIEWFGDTKLANWQAEAVVSQVDFAGSLEGLFPAREIMDEISVDLAIPSGTYELQWLDTVTGEVIQAETISQQEKVLTLLLPHFDSDVALSMRRVKQ
ncbi:hypothetical protein JXA70_03045 [candidate division KSB1 bacterium]|nr:hypothetical protein [candidate division KSB1 bacterium]